MGRGLAMWALRRAAASPARGQGRSIMLARAFGSDIELSRNTLVYEEGNYDNGSSISGSSKLPKLYFTRCSNSTKSSIWSRNISSYVGAKSGEKDDDLDDGFSDLDVPPDDDLDDGFSDLVVPPEADSIVVPEEKVDEDDAVSETEGEISEEDTNVAADNLLDLSESEPEFSVGKRTKETRIGSPLAKIIMDTPPQTLTSALDKWVEEGNPLGRGEIFFAILKLRRCKLYRKALQFLEWVEANKRIEFGERDYASQLDLVAKVHGPQEAESYVEKIPDNLRGEMIYRTLLATYVAANNVKKAEDVFKRIKKIGLPITSFSCDQLLLLYKKVDRKKIADVLLMMENENVKPSSFTYRILIDIKGSGNDISGMEQILDTMKAEGMGPDLLTQAMIARYYIFAGLQEKAEAIVSEMEGDDIKENRPACRALLPLYATLGRTEDVSRIWDMCKSNPKSDECLAAIDAWGKLGEIEKAEGIFKNMTNNWKKVRIENYNSLLKVYANNKLLSKGKELAKRMSNDGYYLGPVTWHMLVKLYLGAGEVEKADAILHKASQQKRIKPLYSSYLMLLDQYAARGDIHNAEKIFLRLRQAGYGGRAKPYQALLQTYINAKTPAYGFWERMKAENIIPNKAMAAKIASASAFRKTQILDLLE